MMMIMVMKLPILVCWKTRKLL